jgi:hypothetical protein
MEEWIKKSDAIDAVTKYANEHTFNSYNKGMLKAVSIIASIPSADRPKGEWIDKAISLIDDMQREGIVDYQQAWEFRMRARMKGADDD